jgi:hypothetical protein
MNKKKNTIFTSHIWTVHNLYLNTSSVLIMVTNTDTLMKLYTTRLGLKLKDCHLVSTSLLLHIRSVFLCGTKTEHNLVCKCDQRGGRNSKKKKTQALFRGTQFLIFSSGNSLNIAERVYKSRITVTFVGVRARVRPKHMRNQQRTCKIYGPISEHTSTRYFLIV